jgi:thiol-disulfide isomerase/thioredoxin
MRCPSLAVALVIGVFVTSAQSETAPDADSLKSQLSKTVVIDGWASRHFVSEYLHEDTRAIVCVFMSTECPLVKLYVPTLQAMEKEFRPQGIQFLGVFSNAFETLPMINAYGEEMNIPFPILKDDRKHFADCVHAERTPEVVVLDREFRVRYKGLINDQFRAGGKRPKVEKDFLRDALRQLVAGEEIAKPLTLASGCHIEGPGKSTLRTELTYSRDIAPLIQESCQTCHRPGQVGPFSLLTYKQVRRHARMIEEVITDRRMPPWHAETENKVAGGFHNDRRLSQDAIDKIVDWVRGGAPEGDPADLPPKREWKSSEWEIGEPDLVLEMQEEFEVPADGVLNYKYFKVRPQLTEDRWVKAVEIQPGNAAVVHHISVHVAAPRRRKLFGRLAAWHLYGSEGERARVLGSYAPGAPVIVHGKDHAMKLPKGYDLIFEVHYTPIGTVEKDRSRIGLVFDDATPKHEVKEAWVIERKVEIPAGDSHYAIENTYTLEKSSKIMSLRPHMHLRGKSWRFELISPDGKVSPLMTVPRWDYEWQDLFEFKNPITVPAGTKIRCVAHWDNSANNPNNPDATRTIDWGLQSEDEMMHWRVTFVATE